MIYNIMCNLGHNAWASVVNLVDVIVGSQKSVDCAQPYSVPC